MPRCEWALDYSTMGLVGVLLGLIGMAEVYRLATLTVHSLLCDMLLAIWVTVDCRVVLYLTVLRAVALL